jgi:dTDP-4-dehydrorhamnose 3,5-epimerase
MSGRFEIEETAIVGVKRVRRLQRRDERGFFERLYCAEELAEAGLAKPVVQVNRSFTRRRAVVRGMHFQHPPHSEIKLVSCLRGAVFDVALDLRAGSPTYLNWTATVLSGENSLSLLIPEGCAHGFQTLSENCEMLYFHTAFYSPEHEGGVDPRDGDVAIAWPEPIAELSARDAALPPARGITVTP